MLTFLSGEFSPSSQLKGLYLKNNKEIGIESLYSQNYIPCRQGRILHIFRSFQIPAGSARNRRKMFFLPIFEEKKSRKKITSL